MKPHLAKMPAADPAELQAAIQRGHSGLCPSVRQQLAQLFSTLARTSDPLRLTVEELPELEPDTSISPPPITLS